MTDLADISGQGFADVFEDAGYATVQGTQADLDVIQKCFPGASPQQIAMLHWNTRVFDPDEPFLIQDKVINTFRMFILISGMASVGIRRADNTFAEFFVKRVTRGEAPEVIMIPMKIERAPITLKAGSEGCTVLRISGEMAGEMLLNSDLAERMHHNERMMFLKLLEFYAQDAKNNEPGAMIVPLALILQKVIRDTPEIERAIVHKLLRFIEKAALYDPDGRNKQKREPKTVIDYFQYGIERVGTFLTRKRRKA